MYLKPSKRKKARMRTVWIIAIAVIAAGVVALLFFLGVFSMFALSGNINAMDQYLPDTVFANENGILYNESDTLHLLDNDGLEKWNLALEMEGSQTVTSPDLICNYAGKAMQVMTYTKEQMFSTSIDTDILDAAVGTEAVAILTQGTVEETGALDYRVSLFNTSGEQTGQIPMSGRQMVDFGFYGDTGYSPSIRQTCCLFHIFPRISWTRP